MKKILITLALVSTYSFSWAQQTPKSSQSNSVLLTADTIISNSDLKRLYNWNGNEDISKVKGTPLVELDRNGNATGKKAIYVGKGGVRISGEFFLGNLFFSGNVFIEAPNVSIAQGFVVINAATFSDETIWPIDDESGKEMIKNLIKIRILNDTRLTYPGQLKDGSAKKGNEKLITVKSAQEILRSIGYDPGPADGIFGKKTENAIKAFQKDNELNQSGSLDEETSAALKKSGGNK